MTHRPSGYLEFVVYGSRHEGDEGKGSEKTHSRLSLRLWTPPTSTSTRRGPRTNPSSYRGSDHVQESRGVTEGHSVSTRRVTRSPFPFSDRDDVPSDQVGTHWTTHQSLRHTHRTPVITTTHPRCTGVTFAGVKDDLPGFGTGRQQNGFGGGSKYYHRVPSDG